MRCLILALITLSTAAPAAESPKLTTQLEQALQCEGEPSSIVDWLHPLVGQNHTEATIVESGEEIEYRVDAKLKQPLMLAGARTSTVTWQVASEHENFGGIVFAEFDGDADAVARSLSLRRAADENLMGTFRREVPDGSLCPPTVLLTPLTGKRFLLGCGWCNGG
jgi:hypothetical protein